LLALIMIEILVVFPRHLEKNRDGDAAEVLTTAQGLDDPDANDFHDKQDPSKTASQKISGLHLVESKDGQQDWELFADFAEGAQGQSGWNLQNVKVLFFNNGSAEFTVTGQSGAVDSQTKDLHIKGHVVTQSKNGYMLQTEYVEYLSKKREINCPETVKMQGPKDSQGDGLNVTGVGLLAQVELGTILLNKNIHATKLMKEQKMLKIRSEKAQFSGKSREAKFIGDVGIEFDKMTLNGEEAEFRYGAQKDLFDFLNIRGAVRVTDGKRKAIAQNLDMDLLDHQYVFSGNPKLIQDGDELLGEKIIFLDRGKRVKVDKINANGQNLPESHY